MKEVPAWRQENWHATRTAVFPTGPDKRKRGESMRKTTKLFLGFTAGLALYSLQRQSKQTPPI